MAEINMSMEDGSGGVGIAPTVIPKAAPAIPNAPGSVAVSTPEMPQVVPLWDPAVGKLRAVPTERAKEFADMGWTVGAEAESEALKHSGLAKIGAASMALSNATSLGGTDALLSNSKDGKAIVRDEERVRSDNAGYSMAGSLAGIGIVGYAGGFAGGLSESTIAAASKYGMAGRLGAGGLNVALAGAPAMAVQGALDSVTEDHMLNHPVSIQHMAAGALHNVIENAAWNAVGHGIWKSAAVTAKGVGGLVGYAEKFSLLKKEMIEVPPDPTEVRRGYKRKSTAVYNADGSPIDVPLGKDRQLTAREIEIQESPSLEHADVGAFDGGVPEPERVDGAIPLPGDINLDAEMAAPSAGNGADMVADLGERIDAHDGPNMAAIVPEESAPVLEGMPARPEPIPLETVPVKVPHYPTFQPPIPMPRKPIREPTALGKARAAVESAGNKADLAAFDAEHAQALKIEAEEARSSAEESLGKATISRASTETPKAAKLEPEQIDFEFEWRKGDKPKQQISKLRELMRERLADVGDEALAKWDQNQALENEIKAIEATKGFPNADAIIAAKIDAKEQLKRELEELAPREVDNATGVAKPGFRDYNNEYSKIMSGGRDAKNTPAPLFRPKGQGKAAGGTRAGNVADELHEAKVASDAAKAHMVAVRDSNAADEALSRAEQKLLEAEATEQRLQEAYDLKVSDDAEFRDAKDARTDKIAIRRHTERMATIEANYNSAVERLKIQIKNKKITAENQKAMQEWRDEVAARKAKIKDNYKKAKRAEDAAESERKAKIQSDRAAERVKAQKDAEAARDAKAAAKIARDDAEAAAKQKRKATEKARKDAEDADKEAKRAEKKWQAEQAKTKKTVDNGFTDEGEIESTWSDAEGEKTETRRRTRKGDKIYERVVLKVKPHAPQATLKKGENYKMPFDGTAFGNVGKAGFYTGMPGVAFKAGTVMATANAAVWLANQRKVIGAAWQKYAGALAKGSSVAYKAYKRAEMREHHGSMSQASLDMKDYPKVARAIGYLAENPQAIASHLQRELPALNSQHPKAVASIAINIQRGVEEIYKTIPKRPYSPTLQDGGFSPTRAQKVAVLRLWQAMGDPAMALQFGDHTVFAALDNTYPDLQADGRQQMMHHIQNSKTPIRGRQARQLTQFIGAPVRAANDSGALKRMQQTAGPEPMKPPGQQGGGAQGSGSAKIKNQAATREATGPQMAMLGV